MRRRNPSDTGERPASEILAELVLVVIVAAAVFLFLRAVT